MKLNEMHFDKKLLQDNPLFYPNKQASCKNHLPHDPLLIENIIDGMHDWVRVIDRQDRVIYMNHSMRSALGNAILGEKCYSLIGRDTPCANCISRKAVFTGEIQHKEECIGDQVFSVMSSPVKDQHQQVIAVVEVLRDITEIKQLQNKILEQNEKLQADLNIARKLQCSWLPKDIASKKLKFSYIYKPCETLGGDLFDIFTIDDRYTGLFIADVSGHGVSASMLTIFLRTSINRNTISPAMALEELYQAFNRYNFGDNMYITLFYAIFDTQDNMLIYANAGHNVSPFIYNKDRFEPLRIPGIPISDWLEETPKYIEQQTTLQKGDRLFLCTDGIIEIQNSQNEQFGEERLLELLLKSLLEPAGTLNHLVESACSFAEMENSLNVPDDITMALIEVIA